MALFEFDIGRITTDRESTANRMTKERRGESRLQRELPPLFLSFISQVEAQWRNRVLVKPSAVADQSRHFCPGRRFFGSVADLNYISPLPHADKANRSLFYQLRANGTLLDIAIRSQTLF